MGTLATHQGSSGRRHPDVRRRPPCLCQGIRLARPGLLAILLAGFALTPAEVNAGSITYNIINYTGSVTGTITTDGKLGTIFAADITSWDILFNLPNHPSMTFTPSDSELHTTTPTHPVPTTGLTATATTLTLNPPQPGHVENDLLFQVGPNLSPNVEWFAYGDARHVSEQIAGYGAGAGQFTLQHYPIANALATASVPEPSTAVLGALAAFCGLTYGWARHRSQGRRQRPAGQHDATE